MNRAALPLVILTVASVALVLSSPSSGEDAPATSIPPPSPAVPAPVSNPTPTAPATGPVRPADAANPLNSTNAANPVRSTFPSPEAAARALIDALDRNDDDALKAMVPGAEADVVQDGKDPIVASQRRSLAAAARTRLVLDRQPDGRTVITVGSMAYPLAIPLVMDGGAWRFDAQAGRDELLARRVGEHELEAIGICLAYADAQFEYAKQDRDGDGVKEYAQRLNSSPGQKDGLHWDSEPGEGMSPAGPDLVPLEESSASPAGAKEPFDGYLWRILRSQGEKAPGGAYSYVINGNMIAGFALLGVPATHRNSGVMSFLVSNHGKVYEKDLGADTRTVAAAIDSFNPDETWREVDADTLRAADATSPADAPFVEKRGDGTGTQPPSGAYRQGPPCTR